MTKAELQLALEEANRQVQDLKKQVEQAEACEVAYQAGTEVGDLYVSMKRGLLDAGVADKEARDLLKLAISTTLGGSYGR